MQGQGVGNANIASEAGAMVISTIVENHTYVCIVYGNSKMFYFIYSNFNLHIYCKYYLPVLKLNGIDLRVIEWLSNDELCTDYCI